VGRYWCGHKMMSPSTKYKVSGGSWCTDFNCLCTLQWTWQRHESSFQLLKLMWRMNSFLIVEISLKCHSMHQGMRYCNLWVYSIRYVLCVNSFIHDIMVGSSWSRRETSITLLAIANWKIEDVAYPMNGHWEISFLKFFSQSIPPTSTRVKAGLQN